MLRNKKNCCDYFYKKLHSFYLYWKGRIVIVKTYKTTFLFYSFGFYFCKTVLQQTPTVFCKFRPVIVFLTSHIYVLIAIVFYSICSSVYYEKMFVSLKSKLNFPIKVEFQIKMKWKKDENEKFIWKKR